MRTKRKSYKVITGGLLSILGIGLAALSLFNGILTEILITEANDVLLLGGSAPSIQKGITMLISGGIITYFTLSEQIALTVVGCLITYVGMHVLLSGFSNRYGLSLLLKKEYWLQYYH